MSKLTISQLFIYPIKSTFRIPLNEQEVNQDGLKNDRILAIINQQGQVLTARENQRLFAIRTALDKDKIIFHANGQPTVEYALWQEGEQRAATLFKRPIEVTTVHDPINDWLSAVLDEPVQLAWLNQEAKRAVEPEDNGQPGDFIQFQDASPIHLVSTSSLKILNEKLDQSVSIHRFRPNIVVQGSEAYAEDSWKELTIGECVFEMATKTARCTMTTIHPETREMHSRFEPLTTLSRFRRVKNKINFGIYLMPRKLGTIRIGDEVVVTAYNEG